jgi:adenylate cyclase
VGPIREDSALQGSAGSTEPGAAEVRAALERVLASRCFEQAARSSAFLRYVVEQTLAGQGDRLKGYTIAVEVFSRPPDFDAQTDPLVRVEAGRLRRRLIEYYADEGSGDPVRLELPRGSYSVVSSYHVPKSSEPEPAAVLLGPMPAPTSAESAAARTRRRWRRIRTAAVVAVVAASVTVFLLRPGEISAPAHTVPNAAPGLAGRSPIVVEPFEALDGAAATSELAAALTEEIFLVLDGPQRLVVAAEASGAAASGTPGYVLTGSVREMEGGVRITARVLLADAGTQVWTAAYDESLDSLRSATGERRIARRIAVSTEPYGPVFDVELQRVRALTAHEPDARECVLRYYEYRRVFGAAEHARALDCFELTTARDPDNAEAWAGLSLLTTDAWAHGFGGHGGSDALLERARETARRAMDIDGGSLHANLALAGVQYFSGADFHEVAERVLSAWPENAEAEAYIGSMFVLTGETERGRALVADAIEWTAKAPSGYYASSALAALREHKYDEALSSALRIDSTDWPLGHLILAAAGSLGGRADLAKRARERLMQLEPTIATKLPDLLRRWRVEPELAGEIERGFAAAAQP